MVSSGGSSDEEEWEDISTESDSESEDPSMMLRLLDSLPSDGGMLNSLAQLLEGQAETSGGAAAGAAAPVATEEATLPDRPEEVDISLVMLQHTPQLHTFSFSVF